MTRLAWLPVDGDGTAQQNIRHGDSRRASATPLYRQVCDAIESLAMAAPLGDESPLPPESELMAQLGVSRGTLRRATDELARQGLLQIQSGRGTFVDQAAKVRLLVWERLAVVARPDSRFDLDLSRFVPDFEGREGCDERLLALDAVTHARTIFVAPDNSLEAFRAQALAEGKRLLVPTYGTKRGFVLLEGGQIDATHVELAATLDGMERHGRILSLDDLRALGSVDLVLTGAVAVTTQGVHFGSGDGNLDLEWALLRHLGLVTAQTPLVVSVHDCQVLEAHVRPGPHDAVVDVIVTPTRVLNCAPALPKPDGIFWREIRGQAASSNPYVRELLARQQAAAWTSQR